MRFLEGLGASGAVVMYRSIAADLHAGRELATLMAVVGAIQGIAPVTAPMIGALIAEAAGWREIFMLLLAIGVSLTETAAGSLRIHSDGGTRQTSLFQSICCPR